MPLLHPLRVICEITLISFVASLYEFILKQQMQYRLETVEAADSVSNDVWGNVLYL